MNYVKKWQVVKSEMVLNHRWCQVRQDVIKLPNGKIIDDFFLVVRPEVALVLPITNEQEIVFVRQYRHGAGEILLELPAGSFDAAKEDAETAAVRELKEETGYISQKFTKLATLYDNPVKDTNKIHLFLAENVNKIGEQTLDITEDIEIVLIPVESVLDQITKGEIAVTGSIAALFLGLNFLNS
ncbi:MULTISPECIES: NUDIX hydrolase [unclassified Nodularia (in: cyanobacteria)]|uniref:NUDIX hydrolase n=1 Tax=unclassified Nodularia (in: cyanobacteria) TaxID=2656917 RepID=UPI00187E4AF9|nr:MULTISPECIES: NUDIX hydrolase [unclassified Nodularia (in: cyanobacteria)]MBE9200327.1 NUDIX hydrolase [Nodularia sp. LEGE 06071]MCC2694228.1 NUDIX hydrolase [Nodularia sp. LEGE 04288]